MLGSVLAGIWGLMGTWREVIENRLAVVGSHYRIIENLLTDTLVNFQSGYPPTLHDVLYSITEDYM